MIIIRECKKSEGGPLTELAVNTFFEAFSDSVNKEALDQYNQEFRDKKIAENWLTDSRTKVWVADNGTEFLGFLTLTPPDLPILVTARDLEMKKIYIFSKAQRQGIGKKLLDKAIQFAASVESERLLLGVNCENKKAISFYERSGFVKVGERKFRVGNELHDDFIYAYHLP